MARALRAAARRAPGRAGRLHRALRAVLSVAGLLVILWSAGLVWFADSIQRGAAGALSATDAIVVPTGGSGRIKAGAALLRAGLAKRLLVSGVAHQVDLSQVLDNPELSASVACCIELGHAARDTAGNAAEAAAWMARNGFTSLRLVTGSYHMPRTMMEFRRAMPDATLIAHPVFPQHVRVENWWRFRGTAALIASEYAKYLLTLARIPLPG